MRTALLTLLVAISLGANAQSDREIAALNKVFWHYHSNGDVQYNVIKEGRLFTAFSATDSITGKKKLMMNVASLNSIKSVEAIKLLYEDPATKDKEEYLSLRISATWVEAEEAGKYDDGDFSVGGKDFKLSKSDTKGEWDVIVCSSEEKLAEAVFMDMAEALKKVVGLAHASYSSLFTAAASIASYKEGVTSIDALNGTWEAFGISPIMSFESLLTSKEYDMNSPQMEILKIAISDVRGKDIQFDSRSKKFKYKPIDGQTYKVNALRERIEFMRGSESLGSMQVSIWEPAKGCGCGDGVFLVFRNYFLGVMDLVFKLKR